MPSKLRSLLTLRESISPGSRLQVTSAKSDGVNWNSVVISNPVFNRYLVSKIRYLNLPCNLIEILRNEVVFGSFCSNIKLIIGYWSAPRVATAINSRLINRLAIWRRLDLKWTAAAIMEARQDCTCGRDLTIWFQKHSWLIWRRGVLCILSEGGAQSGHPCVLGFWVPGKFSFHFWHQEKYKCYLDIISQLCKMELRTLNQITKML